MKKICTICGDDIQPDAEYWEFETRRGKIVRLCENCMEDARRTADGPDGDDLYEDRRTRDWF